MNVTKKALKIERIANCDVFVGQGIETEWKRLYGGQTIAQSLMAACATVSNEQVVHSLHAYFILAGDSTKQILFNVERVRDGKSFTTRAVEARQDNKTICHLQCSFHRPEIGVEYQVKLKEFPELRDLHIPPPEAFLKKPSEDLSKNISRYTINQGKDWKLSYVRVEGGNAILKGDWKTNCSMLTFISDLGMVGMIRQPHGPKQEWAFSVSLDHSIHFHRPLDIHVGDWMIIFHTTKISMGGRGTAIAFTFNLDGDLLATFNQEGLIRPKM